MPVVSAHQVSLERRRSRIARLVFTLYLATLSVDAIRKVTGAPASILGIVYVITALIYIAVFPGNAGRRREAQEAVPRMLPVWLFMLSLWCLAVALVQHVPLQMAFLGWASYVFFVPLFYVGAELAADDRLTVKALRVMARSGGVIAVGVIGSAVLGQSAPALLQPIIPAVGIHSSSAGNIYLAPSIFATSEEASEQLLIALFAWAALAYPASGKSSHRLSTFLLLLTSLGLIEAARRTDIYVAIGGIIAALMVGRIRAPSSVGRFAARARGKAPRRFAVAIILAVAGAVACAALVGGARLASFLTSGSPESRIAAIFALHGTGSPIGQGPGTSTQGAIVIGAQSLGGGSVQGYVLDGRTFITVEGGLGKTWLELGIVGVALYGAVFWTALAPAIGSLRRLDGVGAALTVLAIALGIVFLKGHQSLDDPLIQPLFWLCVGGIWGRASAGRVRSESRPDAGSSRTGISADMAPKIRWGVLPR
ncbi:MAG: hypothetical protein ACRDOL_02970 [Streptosporangiaceae bacterium]